jgi:hypothetical protein
MSSSSGRCRSHIAHVDRPDQIICTERDEMGIHKMLRIAYRCGVIGFLVLSLPVMAQSPKNDYIDRSLPAEVSVAPYPGERYEAEIPDTLELTDHARLAINALTRLVTPEWDYEQYCGIRVNSNPPVFNIGGGLVNINPKWLEALPGLRIMTGSTENIGIDGKLMDSILHVTGQDGLCYYPVENRPWALFNTHLKEIGKPYSDVFGEGRQLLAYAVWYQHDQNPMWKELAERKIQTLIEMTLEKEDTRYFRLSRGYTPWDGDRRDGPVIPSADVGLYPVEKGMTGAPATYIAGFIPQAAANWYRLTGYEPALELGGGLANYLFKHGEMQDPDTGKTAADHPTHVTHSLLSNLAYALTVKDREMTKWVKRGFDYLVRERDRERTGILLSDGTCSCFVADMVDVGIMLSLAGEGDYWEEVDGWVRNTFINLQLLQADMERIKAMPVEYKQDLKPGFSQVEDGAERVLGTFFHSLYKRESTIGCCNGNCSRALYYLWNSIVTSSEKELRVNLLLNRASPWADVDSYLPYEGKVVIRMKEPREHLYIRIPEWTNWNAVSCVVNGQARGHTWSGGFIDVGMVGAKDEIVVGFPMKERVLTTRINPDNLWPQTREAYPQIGQEYEVALKGNTIIGISPEMGLPIVERHRKYQGNIPSAKTVMRFVSREKLIW